MRSVLATILLLFGCQSSWPPTDCFVSPHDQECDAERFVWVVAYQQRPAWAPEVYWREMTCPNHPELGPVEVTGSHCDYGIDYQELGIVVLPWRGSFHESAYAHELMHSKQYLYGIVDPEHTRTMDWDFVTEVNTQLEGMGL